MSPKWGSPRALADETNGDYFQRLARTLRGSVAGLVAAAGWSVQSTGAAAVAPNHPGSAGEAQLKRRPHAGTDLAYHTLDTRPCANRRSTTCLPRNCAGWSGLGCEARICGWQMREGVAKEILAASAVAGPLGDGRGTKTSRCAGAQAARRDMAPRGTARDALAGGAWPGCHDGGGVRVYGGWLSKRRRAAAWRRSALPAARQ